MIAAPSEGDVLDVAGMDSHLVQATIAAMETGSLIPIIKEELKLKIQSKRLAQGKEELPVTEFTEPQKVELTAEDQMRRAVRRANNRRAAQKSRTKKKSGIADSLKELEILQKRNGELQQLLLDMEAEKQLLLDSDVAPCRLPVQESVCNPHMDGQSDKDGVFTTPVSSRRQSRASIDSAVSVFSDDYTDQPLISPGYLSMMQSSITPPPHFRPLTTPPPPYRPCSTPPPPCSPFATPPPPYRPLPTIPAFQYWSPVMRTRAPTATFPQTAFEDEFNSIYTPYPQPSTSATLSYQPCVSPLPDTPCESPVTGGPCESPIKGVGDRPLGNYSMLGYFLDDEEAVVPDSFEYME